MKGYKFIIRQKSQKGMTEKGKERWKGSDGEEEKGIK